jgi:hypothetical protein
VREAECAYIREATVKDFVEWNAGRKGLIDVSCLSTCSSVEAVRDTSPSKNPFGGLDCDGFWAYCDYKDSAELLPFYQQQEEQRHSSSFEDNIDDDHEGDEEEAPVADEEEEEEEEGDKGSVDTGLPSTTPPPSSSSLFSWDAIVAGCAAEGGKATRGVQDATVWVGSKGAHSALHFDTYGVNIVLQVIAAVLSASFSKNHCLYVYLDYTRGYIVVYFPLRLLLLWEKISSR